MIRTVFVCAALVLAAAPVRAQKTDSVMIRNGDRITGEIKNLNRGTLTYSTDDMGTLAIEWDKVIRIISVRYFEIEMASGRRYYGSLQPAAGPGQVVVAVGAFSDTLDLPQIVRINPIGRSFLARLDGYINLGVTFQRANQLVQLSAATEVDYRMRQWLTELQASTYFQDQQDVEGTSRNTLGLTVQRSLSRRWLAIGAGQLEQNEELELDLRALLAVGGGRFLLQSNRGQVLVGGGMTYANESFTGVDATSNLEALITFSAEYFRRDSPKTDLEATLSAFPSLTDPGRVRTDLEVRIAHEIYKDFTLGLTLFHKFDSRPPSVDAPKNDYGITFTAGWTF
jgi:hypothetical protein